MLKVRPPSTRLRWQALAVAAGMLVVLIAELVHVPFVDSLDFYFQDWLLRLTTSERLPKDFVLVAIDEKSRTLSDLEPEEIAQSRSIQLMRAGYPWSREVYTALVEKILDAGARLVIFDVVFLGGRVEDKALAEVIAKYPGRVVLASSAERGANNETYQLLKPSAELLEAANGATGLANFPIQNDSKVRSIFERATPTEIFGDTPLPEGADERLPSLSAVAAAALGTNPNKMIGRDFRRFRYSIPGSLDQVSLHEIFVPAFWQANFKSGAFFKDRIVLIGATAEIMHDSALTPWGKLSGPETQLHALAAFLRGSFLGQASQVSSLISVVLAAVAIFITTLVRRNIVLFTISLILAAAGWLLICAGILYFCSYFLPAAPPFLTLLTCGFAVLVCDVTLERQERTRIRSTFALYVSKDIVEELIENKESFLHTLNGQRQEIVVIFSDLKGFTSDSEKLDPVDLVKMLNEYFGEMVNVVFKYRGTFDKFIGDAFMATWGGIRKATPQEDAHNALLAALEMKKRLAALNVARHARGLSPWGSGVGICQGPAIFGNIGSLERMEPTVIGDTVNLASRIEGLTRIYGVDLLVSERFALNLPPVYGLLHVDTVRVKGRRAPERLFHPYDKPLLDPVWAAAFAAAREKYAAGDFAAAAVSFAALSHEKGGAPGLAHFYRQRCEGLIAHPRENWEGIWDFAEK